MTEFISKQHIQSILASKMAEFNNAMDKIKSAETEAIFADISAKRSEQRMSEFIGMISKWEGIKADSQMINRHFNDSMLTSALFKLNALVSKMQSLESKKAQLEGVAKDAAFKLLDTSIQSLQGALQGIDQKLETCSNPQERQALLAKKETLSEFVQRAKEIKKIEDNTEAMKAFQKFSEDAYVKLNPEKDKYSEEELRAKLQSVKPAENTVFGYFNSIKGVWGLFKEGMDNSVQSMKEKQTSIETQKTQMNEQEIAIKSKIEELNQKEDSILDSLGDYAKWATAGVLGASSLGLGLPIATAAGVGSILYKSITGKDEAANKDQATNIKDISQINLNDVPPEKRAEVETLLNEHKAITEEKQKQEAALTAINQEQAAIEAQSAQIAKITETFENIDTQFSAIDQTFQEVENTINNIKDQYDVINKEIKTSSKESVIADIKNSNENSINKLKEDLKEAHLNIELKKKETDQISNEIQNLQVDLKKSETQNENKKQEAKKEVKQIQFLSQYEENKSSFIQKLSNFIKSNADTDAKVVIDKSLSSLYDDLADDFGTDRVVIDKRGGDRRDGADRRTLQNSQEANDNTFDFSKQRSDTAGRRKGDRRSSNHLFITEEVVSKLNLQS
ncbi:MAG: hypothetical protein AB1782_16795 [Cyanobacteriota bacterium]